MGFEVFDFRKDIRNVVIEPGIRARFMRLEPGEVAQAHTHDLGQEVFLVLQGQAEFEIEGHKEILGPGQMCFAAVDESHICSCVGDEPMIMYLSVTPHIQPTHTGRNPDGTRHPTAFQPSNSYDVATDTETPIDELIDKFTAAASTLAQTARDNAEIQKKNNAQLKAALAADDEDQASAIRAEMWEGVCQSYKQIDAMGDLWNDLTPRAGKLG